MTDRKWGGRREPGPGRRLGRPPSGERLHPLTVYLTREQLDWLKRSDSASEMVRGLVEEARRTWEEYADREG